VSELLERAGRRFARFATDAVVARPRLWRLFRRPVRAQFERLAPSWEHRRDAETLTTLNAALDRLDDPPQRILDVGTGTGIAARGLARRYPDAEVIGVDLSPGMIDVARRLLPEELEPRLRFEVADASRLPFGAGEFDLVVLLNMIPFFDELARVSAPRGALAFVFSGGPTTPMYTPTDRLRKGLAPHGFNELEEVEKAGGTAVLARRSGGR
jgi:ubiquinone/menaquinone biosynthesis C-methylase UbiE